MILLSTVAPKETLSVLASPIVTLPWNVEIPDTIKLPVVVNPETPKFPAANKSVEGL